MNLFDADNDYALYVVILSGVIGKLAGEKLFPLLALFLANIYQDMFSVLCVHCMQHINSDDIYNSPYIIKVYLSTESCGTNYIMKFSYI